LGGTGIAFVFDSRQPGPSVLFRCELDAISVHEETDLAEALRVSEDFGQFSSRIPGVMFGLDAAENCPGLHQADYDFPKELIEIGSKVFMEIARSFVY